MNVATGGRRAGRGLVAGLPVRAATARGRVRTALWPVVQAAVGAAGAFALAQELLGHPHPFFAAVATFVCLGLTDERRLRRVVELAVGVTLGVALGELFVVVFGTGAVQIAVALAAAVLTTVFLHGGQLAASQAGVQAVLVVALPPAADGPFARWQDACVGSAVAVAVAVLLPGDPRRLPRERVAAVATELAEVLEELGDAVRAGSTPEAQATLERARATQPLLDAAQAALRGSVEVIRIAPLRRRHAVEVARLGRAGLDLDRALRNARVVARRCLWAVEGGQRMSRLADQLTALGAATRLLRADVSAGGAVWQARDTLIEVAGTLSPAAADDPQASAVVALLRPLAVDLLLATGLTQPEARKALPRS